MQCIQQRQGASLTYWGAVLIAAVQAGACGSLTTVSTWATEVCGVEMVVALLAFACVNP